MAVEEKNIEITKSNNIIRYDQDFILSLRDSPLVSVPEDINIPIVYNNTDLEQKYRMIDGYRYNDDDKSNSHPSSPSIRSDKNDIVLGPPKMSFASSKQATKKFENDRQARYAMSISRQLRQTPDDRTKNIYKNRYQRNTRERNENHEHPLSAGVQGYEKPFNKFENRNGIPNENEREYNYQKQREKNIEKDGGYEKERYHNNNNTDIRKRNQYQNERYNNETEHIERPRERVMKFDKEKYALRMPNKKDDGEYHKNRMYQSHKSAGGMASAPVGKLDYHSFNRKQEDVPEWMNYSPMEEVKSPTKEKKKMDDIQLFRAKMNRQRHSGENNVFLQKGNTLNNENNLGKDIHANDNLNRNDISDKNIIKEIEKINSRTIEKNNELKNDINEIKSKNEINLNNFENEKEQKMFYIDQYFSSSLDTQKSINSVFSKNNIIPLTENTQKKSEESGSNSAIGESKFSRFFSNSDKGKENEQYKINSLNENNINDSLAKIKIQSIGTNQLMPNDPAILTSPIIIDNQVLGATSTMPFNTSITMNPISTNPNVSLANPNVSLPLSTTRSSPPQLNSFMSLPSSATLPTPTITESTNDDSSIINSFLSKYSIPPEKIINNNSLPTNMPQNQQSQIEINPIKSDINGKKVYSEEEILKSMGINKVKVEESAKSPQEIEQDKNSMNRVMDMLTKSMTMNIRVSNSNEKVISPADQMNTKTEVNKLNIQNGYNNLYINTTNDKSKDLPNSLPAEMEKGQNNTVNLRKQSDGNNSVVSQTNTSTTTPTTTTSTTGKNPIQLTKEMNNKKPAPNPYSDSSTKSYSNNRSSSQILQNLVQHTIEAKLGGNVLGENKNDDDISDDFDQPKHSPIKSESLIKDNNGSNNNAMMNINSNNNPIQMNGGINEMNNLNNINVNMNNNMNNNMNTMNNIGNMNNMNNISNINNMNNMNIMNNVNNINNMPFNPNLNGNSPVNNIMNPQLPPVMNMMYQNNMFDGYAMNNKEEMITPPPQYMPQRPPIPVMQQTQGFMTTSPHPNPNMFLPNMPPPPPMQFSQLPNEQQPPFQIHQGIYPGMSSNFPGSMPQVYYENMNRNIPISMILSENIGSNPQRYVTVEELERHHRQQMK